MCILLERYLKTGHLPQAQDSGYNPGTQWMGPLLIQLPKGAGILDGADQLPPPLWGRYDSTSQVIGFLLLTCYCVAVIRLCGGRGRSFFKTVSLWNHRKKTKTKKRSRFQERRRKTRSILGNFRRRRIPYWLVRRCLRRPANRPPRLPGTPPRSRRRRAREKRRRYRANTDSP